MESKAQKRHATVEFCSLIGTHDKSVFYKISWDVRKIIHWTYIS
jgi:hypothetical protein